MDNYNLDNEASDKLNNPTNPTGDSDRDSDINNSMDEDDSLVLPPPIRATFTPLAPDGDGDTNVSSLLPLVANANISEVRIVKVKEIKKGFCGIDPKNPDRVLGLPSTPSAESTQSNCLAENWIDWKLNEQLEIDGSSLREDPPCQF